ncbi:copper transporter [Haloglycomyces albus]|uniref:copper transporter n=1 Tax=Haloglycomyces albus TaxID=526067 RepID=UPI00046D645C|nr:copper transporter [Haloglycomyces albus]
MINFRYHLISLTAVFLALTVGLILGTAALNGPALDALSETTNNLKENNQTLRDEIKDLRAELNDDQSFAAEIAPSYLDGKLADSNVLLLTVPSADPDSVDGVKEMLEYSGAGSAGHIDLYDKFFEQGSSEQLADLADRTAPETLEVPVVYNGVEAMSSVLAGVATSRHDGEDIDIESGDVTTVVSGLDDLDMANVEEELTAAADAVIVIGGGAAGGSEADYHNDAVVSLVEALAADTATTYATKTSAGEGNPLLTIREEFGDDVSTVDGVVSIQGQIAAVAATVSLVSEGAAVDLGTGDDTDGLLPGNI